MTPGSSTRRAACGLAFARATCSTILSPQPTMAPPPRHGGLTRQSASVSASSSSAARHLDAASTISIGSTCGRSRGAARRSLRARCRLRARATAHVRLVTRCLSLAATPPSPRSTTCGSTRPSKLPGSSCDVLLALPRRVASATRSPPSAHGCLCSVAASTPPTSLTPPSTHSTCALAVGVRCLCARPQGNRVMPRYALAIVRPCTRGDCSSSADSIRRRPCLTMCLVSS
mmetsp:Transcript_8627/g.17545  ORF Transcript_8627/g.17545 Transcript_8627/m.17545 type:complete len:230 (+) Transcript_8627:251-940(+)